MITNYSFVMSKSIKRAHGFIGLVLAINLFFGCKKFVQVPPPDSGIVGATVYTQNATAAAVLTSIYTNMSDGSNLMSEGYNSIGYLCGLASDELKSYTNIAPFPSFYSNSLIASQFNYFWKEIYQEIYVANAAIEGLSTSTSLDSGLKAQLMGEAFFIRAFYHFYAVNLFGNVPLVTTTNYQVNSLITQTSSSIVYNQIIADLSMAQGLLSGNYLDPTNAVTSDRIRPNKWAATAMLARVYLYRSNWDSASVEATEVINSGMYNLLSDLDQVFLINSNEAIWQLQSVSPGVNTWDGYYYILTSRPGTGRFYAAMSSDLVNSFEANDNRMSNWIGQFTSGGTNYYYPFKYKMGTRNINNPITEYSTVLRFAEQYLIRAEAEAENGNLSGAAADLNIIRNRAGLANTSAQTQSDLLTAIYHERQVELFTEWGHRWFDLKRTEVIDTLMGSPGNVCQSKGGNWSSNWELFPIPETELQVNPNLLQNPGYGQ
jgi:hypothetical protein